MPIIQQPTPPPQTPFVLHNVTLGTVYNRARAHLNDQGIQIWTDGKLSQFAMDAYTWIYNEIGIFSDGPIEKVVPDPGTIYTGGSTPGGEQDISSLQPVDMFVPIEMDFRLSTSEVWQKVGRKDRLRSMLNTVPARLYEWEWRDRRVFVNSISTGDTALVRWRYQALLPPVQYNTDPILFDNVVEAMAYYIAACGYRSRGQHAQAQAMIGSLEPFPGFGAVCFLDRTVRLLTNNDQFVSRRGRGFSAGGYSDPVVP